VAVPIVALAVAKALVEVDMRKDPFTAKIQLQTTTALTLRLFTLPQLPFSFLIFPPKVAILNIF
jgi:hypothetical protein